MASATLTAVTTTSSSLSSAAGQHLHHSAAGNPSSSLAAGRSRLRKTSAFSGIATASTPNLNALYSSHATLGPSNANGFASSNGGSSRLLAPPSLSRKQSLAALTPGSLAAIPDASETYALNTVLLNEPPAVAAGGTTTRTTATTGGTRGLRSFASTSNLRMAPLTPGRPPMMKAAGAAGLDASPEPSLAVGDTVDVPGAMYGTVRYIGSVAGRKGTFVGVELNPEFASMGKNNGDVDGVTYFSTTNPGAGIFLPLAKAVRRPSPPTSASSFPLTPTMTGGGGLKLGNQNATSNTPPTPSFQKLNQSVGPNRAPSPQGKKPPRTSLPRPDSPVRRLQLNPPPRPSLATPGPATNGAGAGAAAAKTPARYGSPTTSKFAQSVRGTTGDPSKRPAYGERKDSLSGPRSASALGQSSSYDDEDATPTGPGAAAIRRSRTTNGNGGSVGSVSSFNLKMRPASRANEEEIERLRAQLEDRDRQLREQASTLAEMESSLTELQTLMEQADGPGGGLSRLRRGSAADSDQQQPRDVATLRALLREKNDKIAMLTAEFDAHRADFRSTIDTLEMASTETQNLYEKRIAELEQEVRELAERTEDVDSVAQQLKQLEELVQELEEGLEDARRGEAEARGEVEFLRGEVERTRAELRREREKAANGGAAMANGNAGGGLTNGDHRSSASISKELEQKEDEIRGLKAIIHSFTRDSVPESPDKTPRHGADKRASESLDSRMARERLEREVAELRALLESKTAREEELEREIEQLRRASGGAGVFGGKNRGSTASMNLGAGERSSLRDSRGTVILAPRPGDHHGSRSPEAPAHRQGRERGRTLDTMAESDAYSTATETSTLWCEICETSGHDILTCTNMFGPQQGQQTAAPAVAKNGATSGKADSPTVGSLGVTTTNGGLYQNGGLGDVPKPAPLSPIKKQPAAAPQAQEPPRHPPSPDYTQPRPLPVSSSATTTTTVRILPNPMDSGPVAGKDSGIVDGAKWCALCERDGHDSVDCPFEDAF